MSASAASHADMEGGRVVSGFGRTLAVGAVCALGVPAALALGASSLGREAVLALSWWAAGGALLVAVAPRWRTRLAVSLTTVIVGALVLLLVGGRLNVLIAMTLFVAIARSGFLFRMRPARALGIETLVGLGAIVVVLFLDGPGAIAHALACWGWFVAQSFYFLVPGTHSRVPGTRVGIWGHTGDPFDRARRHLEVLLDGP